MRVCIRVFGIVQGVGFRPTVKRHADACDIAGTCLDLDDIEGLHAVSLELVDVILRKAWKSRDWMRC